MICTCLTNKFKCQTNCLKLCRQFFFSFHLFVFSMKMIIKQNVIPTSNAKNGMHAIHWVIRFKRIVCLKLTYSGWEYIVNCEFVFWPGEFNSFFAEMRATCTIKLCNNNGTVVQRALHYTVFEKKRSKRQYWLTRPAFVWIEIRSLAATERRHNAYKLFIA